MSRFLSLTSTATMLLMAACGSDSGVPMAAAGPFALALTAAPQTVDLSALPVDVDGDGFQDLVVLSIPDPNVSSGPSLVTLYRGPISAGPAPSAAEQYTGPAGATCVAVGDVDGDGVKDILIGYQGGVHIVLRGASGIREADVLAGLYADAVQIGDVDGDGVADILASGRGYLFMVRGLGAGVFDDAVHCDLHGAWTLGLFAGNGKAAIAIQSGSDAGAADVRTWDPTVGWVTGATVHFSQPIASLSASDTNADGLADLVAGLASSDTGTALQTAPLIFTAPVEAPGAPSTMSVDLNADGAGDQVVCNGRTTVYFAAGR